MILDFNKQQLEYLSVNLLFICVELFEVQKITYKFLEGRRFFSQLQYSASKIELNRAKSGLTDSSVQAKTFPVCNSEGNSLSLALFMVPQLLLVSLLPHPAFL